MSNGQLLVGLSAPRTMLCRRLCVTFQSAESADSIKKLLGAHLLLLHRVRLCVVPICVGLSLSVRPTPPRPPVYFCYCSFFYFLLLTFYLTFYFLLFAPCSPLIFSLLLSPSDTLFQQHKIKGNQKTEKKKTHLASKTSDTDVVCTEI